MAKIIAEKFRARRAETGYSQDSVAYLSSIARETIANYEAKDTDNVQIKTIILLAAALGDPRDWSELSQLDLDAFETVALELASTYKNMYGEEVFKKELNIK